KNGFASTENSPYPEGTESRRCLPVHCDKHPHVVCLKSGYNRHMQKRRLSLLLLSFLLVCSTFLRACDPVQEPPATEPAPSAELPTVMVSTIAPELLPTATEVPSPISVN